MFSVLQKVCQMNQALDEVVGARQNVLELDGHMHAPSEQIGHNIVAVPDEVGCHVAARECLRDGSTRVLSAFRDGAKYIK